MLAELYTWAYRRPHPAILLHAITQDLVKEVTVLDFDAACAERFGQIRGSLIQQGLLVPTAVLMIASVALVHNLIVVTHNTGDYQHIPGMQLVDWLVP